MAPPKKQENTKATLQNACFWLAMRPEGAEIDLCVDMAALLFSKTRDEILKRVNTVKLMAR